MNTESAGTAISTLTTIADDLDRASRWGADIRLPAGLEPVLRRLLAYAASAPTTPPAAPAPPDRHERPASSGQASSSESSAGVAGTDLVTLIMREQPGRVWSIGDLLTAMQERGWTTTSPSPRGVVANTVAKAQARQPIKRGTGRGTYVWEEPDESSSVTEASDDATSPEPTTQTSSIEENGATGEIPTVDQLEATPAP